jgi:hypothetical protein
MAKAPAGQGKTERPLPQIEIEPGAWERFKSLVHKMATKPDNPARKPKAAKGKGHRRYKSGRVPVVAEGEEPRL